MDPADQVLEAAEALETEDEQSDGFAPQALAVAPAASGGPVEVKWEDLGAARPPEDEPELKHLNKVFHGRITRIQKIK